MKATTKDAHAHAVVHLLGFFEDGGPPCAVCRTPGFRVAWLCRGHVLSISLCREHATKVPRGTIKVADIFNRWGAPQHSLRGRLPGRVKGTTYRVK